MGSYKALKGPPITLVLRGPGSRLKIKPNRIVLSALMPMAPSSDVSAPLHHRPASSLQLSPNSRLKNKQKKNHLDKADSRLRLVAEGND